MNFISNAEEIRFYTDKLLSDGKVHNVTEIKEYVAKNSRNAGDFTDGMYAGAIRSMVQSGRGVYASCGRGRYCKSTDGAVKMGKSGSIIKNDVVQILERACSELERACTVSIINLSTIDMTIADKVSELMEKIQETAEEIRSL